MSVNENKIELFARALVNRLEDRGIVEFRDAHEGLELVVRALTESLRWADEEEGGER
ncbi:MAG TPA: hypothetical protein VLU46_04890 [Thermoanaerobaculia bacterium]|nr:hypothetical protein [Thermoanaerobaculia bacterium]